MNLERYVLDASAAVKWFRQEAGSVEMWQLIQHGGLGSARVLIPEHCAAEVVSAVRREQGGALALEAWKLMGQVGVEIVPLQDDFVQAALIQCDVLGCAFYDGLAPGLASMIDARLVSADRKAHARYPGVKLIG